MLIESKKKEEKKHQNTHYNQAKVQNLKGQYKCVNSEKSEDTYFKREMRDYG